MMKLWKLVITIHSALAAVAVLGEETRSAPPQTAALTSKALSARVRATWASRHRGRPTPPTWAFSPNVGPCARTWTDGGLGEQVGALRSGKPAWAQSTSARTMTTALAKAAATSPQWKPKEEKAGALQLWGKRLQEPITQYPLPRAETLFPQWTFGVDGSRPGWAVTGGYSPVKWNEKQTKDQVTWADTLHAGHAPSVKPQESLPDTASALDGNASLSKPINNGNPTICLSEGCIHEASALLKNMDLEASPCDDFYQFTCGKFRKKPIPDDKSSLSIFSEINDRLQQQLRSIMEEPVVPGEPRPFTYAKTLYRVCMNKSRIEAEGESRARNLLQQLGGWPVLEGEGWDEGSWDWREAVYRFREAGLSVDYIIDFSVTVDYKNSTYRIIDLDQASLALNREFFVKGLENRLVAAYAKYMVDMAVLFGANKARAQEELAQSLNFEMQLANISLPMEKKRNATALYNKMTIQELQAKFPTVPWREYISKILPSKLTITENEPVIVEVPTYLQQLEKILEQTPKRVVANYMMWRAAGSMVSYMPEKFRARQLEYYTAVTGTAEREARWKECADHAGSSLSLAVGSLYIRKYFDEDAKNNALELVKRIRAEMYKILEAVDWMDEETRHNALEKAKTMTEHIAYPDELLDHEKLEKFYQGYEISDGHFLDAVLNTTKFAFEFNFGRLRDPVNKTEWFSHGRPTVVNAYYNSIENSIQFPAGILQGTFFSNKRPSYMNYGAIGYVIGHEITHGFDDQGRQFDAAGNLVDWWQAETKEKYLEKARCIIEQYGNYTDSQVNMSLNGINTQGENIADNGGIKEAYRAYLSWAEENGEEPRLPGLQEYNPRQMFWISAGSVWCTVYRNETLSNRITTGYHSPGEFRVRGPMSNRPEFAKDFNCPLGSPMNPVKKCQVW